MKPIINIHNLEKSYQGKPVLREINLTIQPGEICAILGKNGAGKSTLFKLIAGMATCTGGRIEVLNSDPTDPKIRKHMGITINEPVFYEHLSGWQNLQIHAAYYGVKAVNINQALLAVDLEPSNQTPVKQYSLGMRQRLSIARCLLHKPELVIIDEPLNGLDPKGIRDFRRLLESLQKTGVSIVMSSHILAEVQSVATRIVVLAEGSIVADETKEVWLAADSTDFETAMINLMEGLAK
ncbi:lantibiotic transport ATP-binding protein [Loigolactobacillus backii]|uniref:Lantibiotic transport ATP-binding protein n=1 Tax=Loigolactobacillus backii TaxID=375175 RepID=A0A192H1W6_9LACO|nr:ATP-binding cassette domain-containing protein [Loigolactobacillus backii]ANK60202.1 lantibiotic transport ATP-binding protein [Loigolactobacillus backii]ANK62355.1 lantibiotic transport ATP-binding protein [Loigolactobacillus backii]ANK65084.1 lantibiotic transport ATP-binding protein [Loigolactobacillus backii]ANK67643.1 lantibiotic transport ATP-binding protein [Loigolactobacillus backii]ANK70633.1 lantibiotic transport ATP-binding protein [Loigolactobacillus backii]